MWTVSAACAAALKRSHTREFVAEIYGFGGALLGATHTTPRIRVDRTQGEIRVDRTANHVRMLSCRVIDPAGILAPAFAQPILDPLQRPTIQTWFEIGWNDPATGARVTEQIPAGRFIVSRSIVHEFGTGATIDVEGTSSSSFLIQENPWLAPYNVPAGVTYDNAIRQAIIERTPPGRPTPQFRFETSMTDTPLGMVFGTAGSLTDPWAELQTMAKNDGKELFDDQLGAYVLRTPPDARDALPVATYNEAAGSPRLRGQVDRQVDVVGAFNGIILNASAPWLLVPVQSVKWDEDPASPTYFRGPFGMHPMFVDDAAVATQEQADRACIAKFNDTVGVTEQVDIQALPNPAHDPGDVVLIESAATGLADLALLQACTFPIGVTDPMPVTIKRRRTR